MRIVLSRKGFDSSAGGVASPILPDGTMLPLPIPARESPIRYREIGLHGHDLGRVVEDLTRGRVRASWGAHLDPDLLRSAIPRARGWRPVFGQVGAAQRVLENAGVGAGDLFLFFGWFRRAEVVDGRYRFARRAEHLHVLWGWLEVGRVVDLGRAAPPAWARDHPHCHLDARRNVLWIGRGGGVFRRYREDLRLTAPGETRSVWRLPGWFRPGSLGMHGDRSRWSRRGGHAILRTAARGQEFVLDAADRSEAVGWARRLISS